MNTSIIAPETPQDHELAQSAREATERINEAFGSLLNFLNPQPGASKTFPRGFRYQYWRFKLKTRTRDFCYSTRPNANGCFCSWIETTAGRHVKRTDFQEHDLRKEASAFALRQFQAAKEKQKASEPVSEVGAR
jgi:hypothetical protein